MKVKIFLESTMAAMEAAINKWLAQNPHLTLTHIKQSESGDAVDAWSITISVWYIDAKEEV